MDIISLTRKSSLPKYKQIVVSIEQAIEEKRLQKGDKLPSLNVLKDKYSLSRDTVLTAFNELKNRGIINSVVGKGYYVSSTEVTIEKKIFLLFDELNSFKEDLYNSFLVNLGQNVQVDIFFHHFNKGVFTKLIHDNIGNYNYYVLMPANLKETQKVILNLPKESVYLLDQVPEELSDLPSIYQNFEKDIYNGLTKGTKDLHKYKKIILVFSPDKQPNGILKGFLKYCNTFSFTSEVIGSLKDREIFEKEVYFVLDDSELILLIKKIKEQHLRIAKDVGIISLNDTILKEVVADGVNTISTNFNLMGKLLAEMVLRNKKESIENSSYYTKRKSL